MISFVIGCIIFTRPHLHANHKASYFDARGMALGVESLHYADNVMLLVLEHILKIGFFCI